jgi:2-polyprenyl-3-methyl-5-hydroxy-6-metoxy-1,4-benzoquinol methylase
MNKTLDYYNKIAINYLNETINADMSDLINKFIKYLPDKAHILDLGCGSGRDSKTFLQKGYTVTAIDGSIELCKLASKYIGQEVLCIRFETIDFENEFDGVWACASLLHVSLKDLVSIFKKISRTLKVNGYLFTCFKYGHFEGERNQRYYTDLKEDRLKEIINQIKDFKIIELFITENVRNSKKNDK